MTFGCSTHRTFAKHTFFDSYSEKGEEDKEALAISGLFLDTLVHTIDIQVYENSNDIFRDLKIIYKIPEMMYRGNVEERGT